MWSYFFGKTEAPPPKPSDFGPWALEQLKGAISTGAVDGLLLQKAPLLHALEHGLSELPMALQGAPPEEKLDTDGIVDLDGPIGASIGAALPPAAGVWCCNEMTATPFESGMVSILSTLLQLQRHRPKAVSLAVELLYKLRNHLTAEQCQLLMGPLLGILKIYKGRSGLMNETISKNDDSTSGGTSGTAPQEEINRALLTAPRVCFAACFLLLKGTTVTPHGASPLAAPMGLDILAATLNCVGPRSIPFQVARALEDSLGLWCNSWDLQEEDLRRDLASLGSAISSSILLWRESKRSTATPNTSAVEVESQPSDLAHLEPFYYCFLRPWLLAIALMDSHVFPVDLVKVSDALNTVLVDPWAAGNRSTAQRSAAAVVPQTLEQEKVICCQILRGSYTKQWLVPTATQVSHLISSCGLHEGEVMYVALAEAALNTLSRVYWASPPYVTQIDPVIRYAFRVLGPLVGEKKVSDTSNKFVSQTGLLVAASDLLTQWLVHLPNVRPSFSQEASAKLGLDLRELLLRTLRHMAQLPSSPALLKGIGNTVAAVQAHVTKSSELVQVPLERLRFEASAEEGRSGSDAEKKALLRSFVSTQVVGVLSSESLDLVLPLLFSRDLFEQEGGIEGARRQHQFNLVDPLVRISIDKIATYLRTSYNAAGKTNALPLTAGRPKRQEHGVVGRSLEFLAKFLATSRSSEGGTSAGAKLVALQDLDRLRLAEDTVEELLGLLQTYPGVAEDVEVLAAIAMLVDAVDEQKAVVTSGPRESRRSLVEGFSLLQWKALSKAVLRHTGWVYDDPIVQEACRMLQPREMPPTIPRLLAQFDLWMLLHSVEQKKMAQVVLLCHLGLTSRGTGHLGQLGRAPLREIFRFLFPSHVELQPRAFLLLMAKP